MQVKKDQDFHIYAKDVIMPGAGIEPAHPFGTRDFKSLASTSSAIPAKRKSQKQGSSPIDLAKNHNLKSMSRCKVELFAF